MPSVTAEARWCPVPETDVGLINSLLAIGGRNESSQVKEGKVLESRQGAEVRRREEDLPEGADHESSLTDSPP